MCVFPCFVGTKYIVSNSNHDRKFHMDFEFILKIFDTLKEFQMTIINNNFYLRNDGREGY